MEKITNEDYTNVLGSFMETSLECIDNIDKELKLEKDKNKKAIEYIKNHSYNKDNRWGLCMNEINELLEILQGDDKE